MKPNADTLRRLYWEEKLTLPQIAVRIGVGTSSIHRWMRQHEIATRAKGKGQRKLLPLPIIPHPTEPGVALVPLTNGGHVIIEESDACRVDQYRWMCNKSDGKYQGYAVTTIPTPRGPRHQMMHRLLMGLDETDSQIFVDHKNRNTLDNRRENLRLASSRQNSANRKLKRKGTSIYQGVCFKERLSKWESTIGVSRGGIARKYNLGVFDREVEAAIAYQAVAKLVRDPKFLSLDPIPLVELPSEQRRVEIEQTAIRKFKARIAGQKGKLSASSQYLGVSWHGRKKSWEASIFIGGSLFSIGRFSSEHEAAIAYNLIAIKSNRASVKLNVSDKINLVDGRTINDMKDNIVRKFESWKAMMNQGRMDPVTAKEARRIFAQSVNSKGSDITTSKLNREQVLAIRKRLAQGETGAAIAKDFGVSGASISAIRLKRTWKHI